MKTGQLYRFIFTVLTVIAIGVMSVPATAHQNQNGAQTHQNCPLDPNGATTVEPAKDNSKASAAKANQKSIFDADVLESPFSFFKDANAENDNADAAPQMNAVIIAVKALIATLLSTVL